MNMVDLYLQMNSCERDGQNNVYFVDPTDNTKKEHVGKLIDWSMKGNEVNIKFKSNKDLKFIKLDFEIEK